jgi:hypothetical protein
MIKIIISNPGHHFNNALRVLYECKERGQKCELISFCAFRGFNTPELPYALGEFKRYIFFNSLTKLKNRKAIKTSVSGSSSPKKSGLIKDIIWKFLLRTFLRRHTNKSDKVILFNDNAYPFDKIVDDLVYRGVDVSMIQEGIRFDVPIATDNTIRMYGSSHVDRIFCWGSHSQSYFNLIKSDRTQVLISGVPHLYDISKIKTKQINSNVIGVFTNPIEQFGYCSEKEKLIIFRKFASQLAPVLKSLSLHLLFRPHPNEDLDAYSKILSEANIDFEINGGGIFEAIERVNWGIVWASTVGVELLLKNKPIAQLPLADGRYVFDYVISGAAVPLDLENFQESMETLVKESALSNNAIVFLENHIQLKVKPESIILNELSS